MVASVEFQERDEYPRIVHYVGVVAKDFGVEIHAHEMLGIEVLAEVTNVIDQAYDGCDDREGRRTLAEQIDAKLRGEHYELPPIVDDALNRLAQHLPTQAARAKIADIVGQIFCRSERIRTASDVSEVLDDIYQEGELAMDLCLQLISGTTEEFAEYMRLLGGVCNLIDDMMDAREDIKAGERKYAVNRDFYTALMRRAAPGVTRILAEYPRKRRFVAFLPKSAHALVRYARAS